MFGCEWFGVCVNVCCDWVNEVFFFLVGVYGNMDWSFLKFVVLFLSRVCLCFFFF